MKREHDPVPEGVRLSRIGRRDAAPPVLPALTLFGQQGAHRAVMGIE
jgi:hypothetical protein